MVYFVGRGYVLWVNCLFCLEKFFTCGQRVCLVGKGSVLCPKGLHCKQSVFLVGNGLSCGQRLCLMGKLYLLWEN
jgi:hypothetical protein